MLGIYANLLTMGIPMDAIDRMEVGRYMEVLQHAAKRKEKRDEYPNMHQRKGAKANVVELRKGTIDQFW